MTIRDKASEYIHKKRPEWHDNGVGIVQGSHYRSGFAAGAEWAEGILPTATQTLTDAADRLEAENQSLPNWPTRDGRRADADQIRWYVQGHQDAIDFLRRLAGERRA